MILKQSFLDDNMCGTGHSVLDAMTSRGNQSACPEGSTWISKSADGAESPIPSFEPLLLSGFSGRLNQGQDGLGRLGKALVDVYTVASGLSKELNGEVSSASTSVLVTLDVSALSNEKSDKDKHQ